MEFRSSFNGAVDLNPRKRDVVAVGVVIVMVGFNGAVDLNPRKPGFSTPAWQTTIDASMGPWI